MSRVDGFIKTACDELLDFVYPSSIYCICCGNLIDKTRSYSLCDHCITHIRWNDSEPLAKDGVSFISCTDYGIYERSIVFALKYDGHKYIASTIAEIMEDKLKALEMEIDDDWVIVPVPIHRKKYEERGFNQAALIGKKLGERLGIPMVDALKRTRYTEAMRSLGPTERLANITGSIIVSERFSGDIKGKRVLLIDDFFTTGSTIMACREALGNLPRDITALVFAARRNMDTL